MSERQLDNCEICGKGAFEVRFARNRLHSGIVRCESCGFVFSNPQVEVDYANHDNYVSRHLETERGRRLTARWRLDQIPASIQGRQLLEIGCSVGFFLDEARGRGFNVTGAELNTPAVDYARNSLGLNVLNEDIRLCTFARRFDVIAMFDVFEHIAQPTEFLAHLANELLADDGVMLIEVPNLFSIMSRLQGTRAPHLQYGHFSYFSRRTFRRLAERAGVELVSSTYGKRVYPLRDSVHPLLERQPKLQALALHSLDVMKLSNLVIKAGLHEFHFFVCAKPARRLSLH